MEPEFLEAYGHLDCQWKGFRLLDGVAQAVGRDSVLIYVLHACRAGSHYRRVHVCVYIYIYLYSYLRSCTYLYTDT